MVAQFMAAFYTFGAAFGFTADEETHTTDLSSALVASRELADFLDMCEDQNCELTGRRADAQGSCGNVSTCLRRVTRARCRTWERLLVLLERMGVPSGVVHAISANGTGTACVEKFFSSMRQPWPGSHKGHRTETRRDEANAPTHCL